MNKIIKQLLIFSLCGLVLFQAGLALAAYERYSVGDDVTIGEFVYDDDFQPTTTPCWVTITSPTSTVVVDNIEMTNGDRGWHYYPFLSVYAEGIWPTVMTCGSSTTGDLARLDKTFIVKNTAVVAVSTTAEIANAVWDHGEKTLTDYATSSMVSAIWGVATSTFTTVGSVGNYLVTNLNSTISGIAGSVWSNLNGITRSLTSAIIGTGTENLATESNVTNASSSLASLIGAISFDTSTLATSASIVTLSEQLTAASTSLALTIPSSINDYTSSTVSSASSSLLALLSGLMTSNTNIVTSTINNTITSASSSLSIQIDNASSSLSDQIAFASTSLYSTLNASILSSSSSLASLIGAISFDTSTLATSASIVTLADQLTAASTSLALTIPSNINATITGASSSLASLITLSTTGLATSLEITTLSEQLTAASSSLALTIPLNINDYTNTTVGNASSSLFALLSGLMTVNTDAITGQLASNTNIVTSTLSAQIDLASSSLSGQIAFASSSLSGQLADTQQVLTTMIGNASSSLYSTLNASILSSSSSLATLIGAISLDTTGLATSASIVTLSEQLISASTSLALTIPSSISVTINNVSSSLASLIAGITPTDTGALTTQINNASSSLAALITATGDTLGGKIDNASSSLSGQTVINGSLGSWNVAMSNVDRVLIGQKYKAKVYVTNYKSVPTNSFVVPKISLYNNNGNLVTENISMTLGTSTGSYSYNYTIPDLSEGLWEAEVKTEVESGKIITTNDYFAIEGSPAQVSIIDVIDKETPNISAQVLITNEGSADYEYHYEWCVVNNVNYACRGGHDLFSGSASKLVEVGSSTSPILTAEGIAPGNYYFKLVVYYGMEKSGASRYFTAVAPVTPATCGNGSCSGGETCSSCPADCGVCPGGGGGGGGGGSIIPPVAPATTTPVVPTTCDGADFNHDKKVNSVDFSILLAFWKTAWPFKNSCVDVNKDKQVNSVDFSILMYQWGKKIL